MRCPRCQRENPTQAKFCLECGARMALACPKCRSELPAGAKFYLECGAPVASQTTAEVRFASPESHTPGAPRRRCSHHGTRTMTDMNTAASSPRTTRRDSVDRSAPPRFGCGKHQGPAAASGKSVRTESASALVPAGEVCVPMLLFVRSEHCDGFTATTMYREMGMTYWLEQAEVQMNDRSA